MIQKKSPDNLLIGIMGDVMIGRTLDEVLDRTPPEYIWGDLLSFLHQTDFNLINLEAALTKSEERVEKVFNFKTDPSHIKSLNAAHISVTNLANNHILDFSESGLLETLSTLDKVSIGHIGAGKNIADAQKPFFLSKNGIHIGMIGCTDNEPLWAAKENKPGTFYVRVGDIEKIKPLISEVKKKSDVVILSMHWGPNMVEFPTKSFIEFAHHMIECGVTLFHGHSAHCFQGIEKYKNGLIFYDTGDFVDDYAIDTELRNDESFLYLVEISQKGWEQVTLIPVIIENYRVRRAAGEEFEEIVSLLFKRCLPFDTSFQIQEQQFIQLK